ncbi:MAG: FAD-binding protein [Bacillota bacterium]
MYDIAIIGAGPAGATLARLVGKSYKVLLIDRRDFDGPPAEGPGSAKCCGGLLAPDAQKMMALLGLGLPESVLVGPQLFTVRTIDLKEGLQRYYQRFYINMDREKFDRWLVSLIPPEVDSRFGTHLKKCEGKENTFRLYLSQRGKTYQESARVIVGSDGAFSSVRRNLFPGAPCPEKYVAVQEWFPAEKALPYFTTIFDTDITDFYSWTIPKGSYLILGSAISPHVRVAEKFKLLKNKLNNCGFEFGKPAHREGTFILRPLSVRQVVHGADGIALIGEAAGWISPSSAEGLSYALKSALSCAESLNDGLEGFFNRYYRKTGQIRKNIIMKNLKSPFMYSPILRKVVMSSGLLSMDVLGDVKNSPVKLNHEKL